MLEARRSARDGQKVQLNTRVGQLRDEIAGLRARQDACDRQAVLIEEELVGGLARYNKSLVTISRKTALEREAGNLDGQKAGSSPRSPARRAHSRNRASDHPDRRRNVRRSRRSCASPSASPAGIQADVFVETEDRTPLQYIIKPMKDQIAKAFRES